MRDFTNEGRIGGTKKEQNARLLSRQRTGVGAVAAEGLRRGLANSEVLDRVLATFPAAKTTRKSIASYRAWLRSVGEPVPTQAEAERRRVALLWTQGHMVESPRKRVRRRLPGRLTMTALWDEDVIDVEG